jgi:hypothetical protein
MQRFLSIILLIFQLIIFLPDSTHCQSTSSQEESQADLGLASNSPCDLCRHKFTFIISPGGRTGSTTLLNMLDQLPGYHLNGEQRNTWLELDEVYKNIKNVEGMESGGPFKHPELNEKLLLCTMQEFIHIWSPEYNLEIGGTYGFKSVRIHNDTYFNFMREVFPCANFVLNTRDPAAQTESVRKLWSSKVPYEEVLAQHTKLHDLFHKWHSLYPDNTYMMNAEDFGDHSKWNALFEWLGYEHCKVKEVLHVNQYHLYEKDEREGMIECEGN